LATRTERAIFLINGTQGAGKSTVSRLLAGRFERGVCIDADDLLRLVVSGAAPLEPPLSLEAERQLRLRTRVASRLADTFFEAGEGYSVHEVPLDHSPEKIGESRSEDAILFRLQALCSG
jgi:dephospho-CoA kinase